MYKNSKFTILLPIIVACSIVLGVLLSQLLFIDNVSGNSSASPRNSKINTLLSLIGRNYVDVVSIDSLTEMAIPMILGELDPHSTYIPVDNMAEANESLDGQFDGIGVVFNMATDTVIVINVIPSGPSSKAGIQPGDRIVKVNDTIVAGVKMNQNDVVKKLRGRRGSKVNLGIKRQGINDLVPTTVERGVIPIKCVLASYIIEPGVGYVMFSQFSRNAYSELITAINALKAEGMTKLILDIRSNTGGFLDQAIMITNEFLPKKELIVYTVDRNGAKTEQYSNGKGSLTDLELFVLIDEQSASSSEILAGALQDNDRGTIIGRRSYGKGLVQEQIPFSDGSAVRLTIARYYTPSGRSIQKPYSDAESYKNELITRFRHNEMFSADSIQFNDSLKFKTIGGRTVYGGGGIMPDIFVPADTTDVTPYLRDVVGRNILYRFTIEFSDRNRAALNKITTINDLDRFFANQSQLLNEFVAYAAKNGITANQAEINRSKSIIYAQLKAYIGRNTTLEDNAFYHSIQAIDNVVKESLQVINDETKQK